MKKFKLGVLLESFRLPTSEAIVRAAKLGVEGVQIFAANGEYDPKNITKEKKKELLSMLNANGIEVSALCGDFGTGFSNRDTNPLLIERSKRVIDLALELGTNIVTTHIGVVPTDKSNERYKIMQEACFELANYADSLNAHFAVETGPEPAIVLKEFLDSLNSKGVAVNMDPANLVMVHGANVIEAVELLSDYIVHTHAKDGIRCKPCNPEYIYKVTHPPIEDRGANDIFFREMPLGEGDVPFKEYLEALNKIGYNGYLTIEREVGENPTDDIKNAVKFLKNTEVI